MNGKNLTKPSRSHSVWLQPLTRSSLTLSMCSVRSLRRNPNPLRRELGRALGNSTKCSQTASFS